MVIGIIGESCVGKSTIADYMKKNNGATIYSGKDYLRLSKNEESAKKEFQDLLAKAAEAEEIVIYVITEKEHLELLPVNCVRVLVTADLEVIKERFAKRTGGVLPPPLAMMLEKKHGIFDTTPYDIHITGNQTPEEIAEKILDR